MLGLYLLASHMAGDFLFQNRWHSARKFDSAPERARHVTWYALAFLPVVVDHAGSLWRGVLFLALLWLSHYSVDSRRFRSTIGDELGWRLRREFRTNVGRWHDWEGAAGEPGPGYRNLRPNPWPAMPILIDQTLHVVQIAVLGGLFLSS